MKQIIGLLAIVFTLASCTTRRTVSDSSNISHNNEKKATASNSINDQSVTPATPPMEKRVSSKP